MGRRAGGSRRRSRRRSCPPAGPSTTPRPRSGAAARHPSSRPPARSQPRPASAHTAATRARPGRPRHRRVPCSASGGRPGSLLLRHPHPQSRCDWHLLSRRSRMGGSAGRSQGRGGRRRVGTPRADSARSAAASTAVWSRRRADASASGTKFHGGPRRLRGGAEGRRWWRPTPRRRARRRAVDRTTRGKRAAEAAAQQPARHTSRKRRGRFHREHHCLCLGRHGPIASLAWIR